MPNLRSRVRRVTNRVGDDAFLRAALALNSLAAVFGGLAVERFDPFKEGPLTPLLAGAVTFLTGFGALRIYGRRKRRSSKPASPWWGQIAVPSPEGEAQAEVWLVRSSRAGTVTTTRLANDPTKFTGEAGPASLALSPDGTVAATLRDSMLRVSLVDPVVGEACSWGPSTPVEVDASSVVAVARKGDYGLWCAVSGQRSHLAAVVPGTDPDWKEIRVDGVHPLGESRAAAFVGHQLLVLGRDGNLHQVDAGGAARWSALNGAGGWVAMDAAVVNGTIYLALVRTPPAGGDEGELLVFELPDTQRHEPVHASPIKGSIDLVRVVRSPLTPQRELVVLTVGEADRAVHRCSLSIPAEAVRT